MGVRLGWQRMCNENPYLDGQVINDGVWREGNRVHFRFNTAMKVVKASGYWNYAWYVNMSCGNKSYNGKMVKDRHYGSNLIIGGIEYYMSNFNGNFVNFVDVGGKDTGIWVNAQFYDSDGNTGPWVGWFVDIPRATEPSGLRASVSNLEPESGTISARVDSAGDYSNVTDWVLVLNGQRYHKSTGDWSTSWNLSLTPDTYYEYVVEVTTSSGYAKTVSGSFRTEPLLIGYLIEPDGNTRELTGYIVKKDGTTKRLKGVKKIEQ